jgi:outer membrane protein assembly factor BamB
VIRRAGTTSGCIPLVLAALIGTHQAAATGPVLSELGREAPGYAAPAQSGFVVIDVDGDGRDDYVYVGFAGMQSSLLMVAGIRSDGSFGLKQSLHLPDSSAQLAVPAGATLDRIYVVNSRSGRVHVFGGWPLREVDGFDSVLYAVRATLLDADRDGNVELLIGRYDKAGSVYSYDARSGALRWQTPVPGHVSSFAPATQHDGRPAIVLGLEGSGPPAWLDAATGTPLAPLPLMSAPFLASAMFDDARTPLLVGGGGTAPVHVMQSSPPWTLHWSYQPFPETRGMLVTPLDADSGNRIIVGDVGFPSTLHVLDPAIRTEIWNFQTTDHFIYSVGAGDADGDGTKEIVFGVYEPHETWVASRLRWIDAKDRTEKWRLESQSALFDIVALGDLNGDGRLEQVVAGKFSPIGKTHIVDATTGDSVWESPDPPNPSSVPPMVTAVAIGRIQPGLPDLVFGSDTDLMGRLTVIDGRTYEVTLSIAGTPGHPLEGRRVESIVVHDADGDGIGDIAAATSLRAGGIGDPRVSIFSGLDGSLLAHSDPIDSMPYRARTLLLGDTDADGTVELILIADNRIQVFDGSTLTPRATSIVDSIGGRWVPGDDAGAQVLTFDSGGTIRFHDARTLEQRRSVSIHSPLAAVDVLDRSGARLIALAMRNLHVVSGSSGEIFARSTTLGDVTGSYTTSLAVHARGDGTWQIVGGTDAGYFRFRVDVGESIFEDGFEAR